MRRIRPCCGLFVSIASLAALFAGFSQAQTVSEVGGSITIPSSFGTAVPSSYPSQVTIPAGSLTGTYISLTVALHFSNLNNGSFSSIALLLKSPNGTTLDMQSFGCGVSGSTASYTLTDAASTLFPHTCSGEPSGTYKPAYYFVSPVDNFPSPGPGTTYKTAGDNNAGANVNAPFHSPRQVLFPRSHVDHGIVQRERHGLPQFRHGSSLMAPSCLQNALVAQTEEANHGRHNHEPYLKTFKYAQQHGKSVSQILRANCPASSRSRSARLRCRKSAACTFGRSWRFRRSSLPCPVRTWYRRSGTAPRCYQENPVARRS